MGWNYLPIPNFQRYIYQYSCDSSVEMLRGMLEAYLLKKKIASSQWSNKQTDCLDLLDPTYFNPSEVIARI